MWYLYLSEPPRSHLDTVDFVTYSCRASSSCVRPAALRFCWMYAAKSDFCKDSVMSIAPFVLGLLCALIVRRGRCDVKEIGAFARSTAALPRFFAKRRGALFQESLPLRGFFHRLGAFRWKACAGCGNVLKCARQGFPPAFPVNIEYTHSPTFPTRTARP